LLELKKMHQSKKELGELKECFNRLADDAKVRNEKLEEAKNKKSEEFEEELKSLFRPRLVSN
jgi:nitrate/nitrite-specific signal transduction histidine kinase